MSSYDTWKTNPGPQYDSPNDWRIVKEEYYGTDKKCADCEELADWWVEILVPYGFDYGNYYCYQCAREVENDYGQKEN